MSFKIGLLTIICLGGLAAQKVPIKRQVGIAKSPLAEKSEDHVPAETGFASPAAAVHQGSKFFQYIHRPSKDHVDHGHKRGNDHHFIERHEKEHPHTGEFKTKRDTLSWFESQSQSQSQGQYNNDNDCCYERPYIARPRFRPVQIAPLLIAPLQIVPVRRIIRIPQGNRVRWGDKHGGYGEHYWDYNHGGNGHDGEGGESQQNEEYAEYEEESKAQPVITPVVDILRSKREPEPSSDVEFISDKARSLILDGKSQRHGGNYKAARDYRGKRDQNRGNVKAHARTPRNFGESLVFDADDGIVVDEETGVRYKLSPIH